MRLVLARADTPMNAFTPDRAPTVYWSLGLHPVQSWIVEARRSRDLRAGSRLLAVLMGDLLAALRDEGAEFILPQTPDTDLEPFRGDLATALGGSNAVSNRASGTLSSSPDEAASLLASLEHRLEERWDKAVTEVREAAQSQASEIWGLLGPRIGHPRCPFLLTWVMAEVADGDRAGLERVDELYDAAKRSRPIRAHQGGEVRKCGQCARREAMGGMDRQGWWEFQEALAAQPSVLRGLRISANEFLCPLCALRRFAGYLDRRPFPSTSAIASRLWRRQLQAHTPLRKAFSRLKDTIRQVPGYEESWTDPAQLFYERTALREERQALEKGEDGKTREPKVAEALGGVLDAQKALFEAIQAHNRESRRPGEQDRAEIPTQPSQYLAVLTFDADDLGRHLREKLDSLPGKVRDFQNRLEEELKDGGRLDRATAFYLGGDEGLLLAPVAAALPAVREVRTLWREVVGMKGDDPTLSAGVAIFDRERPLGQAVGIARDALETAKGVTGKDSLAVKVQTASGSVWAALGRWDVEWPGLTSALAELQEDHLSSRWPHAVSALLREVVADGFESEESRDAIRQEVFRLTTRHRQPDAPEKEEELWKALGGPAWWSEEPPPEILETLPEHFALVGFLTRQSDEAR